MFKYIHLTVMMAFSVQQLSLLKCVLVVDICWLDFYLDWGFLKVSGIGESSLGINQTEEFQAHCAKMHLVLYLCPNVGTKILFF